MLQLHAGNHAYTATGSLSAFSFFIWKQSKPAALNSRLSYCTNNSTVRARCSGQSAHATGVQLSVQFQFSVSRPGRNYAQIPHTWVAQVLCSKQDTAVTAFCEKPSLFAFSPSSLLIFLYRTRTKNTFCCRVVTIFLASERATPLMIAFSSMRTIRCMSILGTSTLYSLPYKSGCFSNHMQRLPCARGRGKP
ncbi:hypothetical protein COCMIDRAFT_83406 [Bipolaris oryzae ATCC 44560]|uniref:Uncharacterized protein n=1 Tax=Bipolaris oryzae ATCC 44560 TaxID=930090 RepID=W6ZDS8_COCMI|nr:uncharacterized protein COCMIDRAFT_83406 [Bipolaris oryzae ATCC 44560]EUC49992.1 hypothetical protein COCMIDRAFT_83406 [Bipolaris oryzae ATCC 44560]